ncbi:UNVERIFIED_CONTAM: hypothetical protein HDU68_011232 [Siphonaria sp. JEL0065]|nr:hypothetical protein HDU68_011232 [Siphonaria sp. JEL0065]
MESPTWLWNPEFLDERNIIIFSLTFRSSLFPNVDCSNDPLVIKYKNAIFVGAGGKRHGLPPPDLVYFDQNISFLLDYDPFDKEGLEWWHYNEMARMFLSFFKVSHPEAKLWTNKILTLEFGQVLDRREDRALDREEGPITQVDYAISDEETGKICVIFFCHQFDNDWEDTWDDEFYEEERAERMPEGLGRKMVQGLFAAACHNKALNVSETVFGVLMLGPRYVIYEFSFDYDAVEEVMVGNGWVPELSSGRIWLLESIREDQMIRTSPSSFREIWQDSLNDLVEIAFLIDSFSV